MPTTMANTLFYGDNLRIMQDKIASESVDLVYLDPPFKSDLNYNVLFKADGLKSDEAQLTAFKDTWTWDAAAQSTFDELQGLPNVTLVNFVNALHGSLERTPMLAYLVNMAVRLVEIHGVLKETGSVYLHCDPTASHYPEMLMDAVFLPTKLGTRINLAKDRVAQQDEALGAEFTMFSCFTKEPDDSHGTIPVVR